RRNLDWEAAIEPLGCAGADRRQTRRNALERRKPETDLKGRDQEEHYTNDRKGSPQRAVEATGFVVDLNGIAGNRHQESSFVTEIDGALDETQHLLFRALHVALAGAGGTGRGGGIVEMRQGRIP